MPRCLVVDDDSEIRTLVADYLTRFGLPAVAVADVGEMRRELERESFDVIVLDLMLPGEDGLAACQWLRTHSSIPVIMLSARGDFMSRVIGLELGADDYLAKPFELRELVARINAVLRRAVAATDGAPQRPSLVTDSMAGSSSGRCVSSYRPTRWSSHSQPPSIACCRLSWTIRDACSVEIRCWTSLRDRIPM